VDSHQEQPPPGLEDVVDGDPACPKGALDSEATFSWSTGCCGGGGDTIIKETQFAVTPTSGHPVPPGLTIKLAQAEEIRALKAELAQVCHVLEHVVRRCRCKGVYQALGTCGDTGRRVEPCDCLHGKNPQQLCDSQRCVVMSLSN
jgi:hypothetical protein